MAHERKASARWTALDNKRRSFISRCETYAELTLPKLCTPSGYNQNSEELSHDYQSVGAQSVNHLANKVVLALFAPSRPFFRLDPTSTALAQILKLGITEDDLALQFAKAEKEAIKAMDGMGLRPKLYEAVKHLIVLGNVCLELEKDTMRVIGIKKYVVRRSAGGRVLEAMLNDCVEFNELTDEAQAECYRQGFRPKPEDEVHRYRWIKFNGTDYEVTEHVNEISLGRAFWSKYPEDRLPFQFLTWDLSDDAHYGTGLVEDYKGDFAGLSMLSQAQIQGAILSSEFRWLVNPAGVTKPEDFRDSENGAAIPGIKDDVTLVQSGKAADLQVMNATAGEYVNRIGRGFLLGSAVTRDAERVTAEEIRMQAMELETSLGGAYSRLAVDFQLPMSYWLMDMVGFKIKGTSVKPTIVTGLDALSRGGDLDNLKQFIGDCVSLANIPDDVRARMKIDNIIKGFAIARRIEPTNYIKNDQEVARDQAAAAQQQQEMMAAQAGADAGSAIAVDAATQG